MKPIYFLTNKGTKWTHPILFNSISFSYKKAKCQNNRVFHTLHLPIVTLFKIWQWTCFGEATPLSMHQVVKGVAIWSIVTNIPVLLSLKNNLKTNGFLTENAAKAKCPVWGKGSKGKMVIGLSELHNGQRLPPKWTKLTQLFLVYEKVWPKQRDFWNIKTSLWYQDQLLITMPAPTRFSWFIFPLLLATPSI